MNLRDLRYLLAVAETRHFGRAAELCHVSQPTLSTQIRKLEEALGVSVFERTSKSVEPTEIGRRLLEHARAAVAEADAMITTAKASRDPLSGVLRLGVIPTLAPFLLPLVFDPLRHALPLLEVEPWEDVTATLVERIRLRDLDAAVVASDLDESELLTIPLFVEPFLAALPPTHPLTRQNAVREADLADDLLVLADGHCLRGQAIEVCGRIGSRGAAFRASSLATLMNMVAAGFGTTLIPSLAAGAARDTGLALRPLAGGAQRSVRMIYRPSFDRVPAVAAIARVVRDAIGETASAPPGPSRPS